MALYEVSTKPGGSVCPADHTYWSAVVHRIEKDGSKTLMGAAVGPDEDDAAFDAVNEAFFPANRDALHG